MRDGVDICRRYCRCFIPPILAFPVVFSQLQARTQWKDLRSIHTNGISFTGTSCSSSLIGSQCSCFCSHAHEENLPGTVNLQALEGDDTAYGQALYPVPSEDPNDPLQWSKSKKTMILIIVSLYSFLGNSALVGPSVYLEIYSKEFGISVTEASGLVSYPNLVFGFGMTVRYPAIGIRYS